jgi:hypothetical protein
MVGILNLIFLFFVLKIYCGEDYYRILGISENDNDEQVFGKSNRLSETIIFKVAMISLAAFLLTPLILVTMLTADEKKAKKAEYMRDYRASKSKEKVGHVRKQGHQSTLTDEEEDYLHARLSDDIKHGIHHPLIWLCEKVSLFLFPYHVLL